MCGLIEYGQYVIFQKKNYKKLHLLTEKNSSVFIGRDKIEIQEIFGKKLGSIFKAVPITGLNRNFRLTMCGLNDICHAREIIAFVGSGADNRNIWDDGTSQKLTSDSIEELRDNGTTPKSIIEHLVENSKTFQIKTEYSQEKYIMKKESKYFEYILVLKPTIRLLAELFFSRDIPKSIGIRIDTLSQIMTSLNFQSDSRYLLVDSGFNGIVSAMLLSCISDNGRLVNVIPGSQNQKQAVLAMNFSKSCLSKLTTIRFSTLINSERSPVQDNDILNKNCGIAGVKGHINSNNETLSNNVFNKFEQENTDTRKRKCINSNLDISRKEIKRPRWEVEADLALEILSAKVDGLVIACKEFPVNIVTKLLEYLTPSRPFVVYSLYQEPLVELYLFLKKMHDIINIKISETWLRPYQVLENRTHPQVTVSSSSGYLLWGLKVINK